MRKYPVPLLILTAFIFLILSLIYAKLSFAQDRLYECGPPFDYPTYGNCSSGPGVACYNPEGKQVTYVDGNTCARNAALFYSQQENKTLIGKCVDQCSNSNLSLICNRDAFNDCAQATCGSNNTFCIRYTVAPTPTPTPTPTPSCSNYNSCSTCIFGAPFTCGWNGSFCQSGTNSCPANYSQWYWTSCSTNVCAPTPTPTPTPVPPTSNTPTPTPTIIPCSNWKNCTNCIAVGSGRANDCGWKNGSVCQSGTASCPVGATSWNYSSCAQNECVIPPTPTPIAGPTPTPTRTPRIDLN